VQIGDNVVTARASREAFTLVELLVVIAIVGILIALLLPAVQAAREAARKSHCKNNLKQIGLAMHNYQLSLGSFPTGYLYRPDPQGNQAGFGWAALILPYLEHENVHEEFDFNVPVFARGTESRANGTWMLIYAPPILPRNESSWRWVLRQSSAMPWPTTWSISDRPTLI
jgi:prepilin-type N-terminal cleavage/methylation domain-containing protein